VPGMISSRVPGTRPGRPMAGFLARRSVARKIFGTWRSAAAGSKREERFLSAQADHFTGVKWKEKASACSVRNDGLGGGRQGARYAANYGVGGGASGLRSLGDGRVGGGGFDLVEMGFFYEGFDDAFDDGFDDEAGGGFHECVEEGGHF
jgi:hypothetical protein